MLLADTMALFVRHRFDSGECIMASDQGRTESESRSDGEQRRQASGQKRRAASSASSQQRRTSDTRKPARQGSKTSGQRTSARSSEGRSDRSAKQAGTRSADARRTSTGTKRRSTQTGTRSDDTQRKSGSQRRATPTQREGATSRRSASQAKRRPAARTREGMSERQNSARQKLQSLHLPAGINVAALKELPKPVIAAVCVAALLLVLLVHHTLRFRIQLNGEKATVWRGTSVERLLDKKVVEPSPGNLVAVDGLLIAKGEGERCTVTIDGTTVSDLSTKIHRGADLQITDGGNITEDFTTAKETIPHDTVESSRDFDSYWYTSLHLLSDGQDGLLVKRTGKISGTTVSEIETPAIDAGYITYTAQPDEKAIALTFDDGPWPETTDQILDILEENGAKATFFTIGNQISSYADSVRRANQMGCQVCTHSWDHAAGSGDGTNLTLMTSQEQIDEILKGYQAIADVLGEEPEHIMRAPGGNFYGNLIDTLWQYVDVEVGWDVDTEDWRLPGSDAIAERLLSVQSGQVVLMHDGGGDRTQTVEALRIALPQLKAQGYKFVTIDEMLAYGRPGEDDSGVISVG